VLKIGDRSPGGWDTVSEYSPMMWSVIPITRKRQAESRALSKKKLNNSVYFKI